MQTSSCCIVCMVVWNSEYGFPISDWKFSNAWRQEWSKIQVLQPWSNKTGRHRFHRYFRQTKSPEMCLASHSKEGTPGFSNVFLNWCLGWEITPPPDPKALSLILCFHSRSILSLHHSNLQASLLRILPLHLLHLEILSWMKQIWRLLSCAFNLQSHPSINSTFCEWDGTA